MGFDTAKFDLWKYQTLNILGSKIFYYDLQNIIRLKSAVKTKEGFQLVVF